ncbi:MAG: aspartyl protease family protein [Armatimonadetes bacterium]|nr:aspartyl protease family protein [Armatimonadota bacterium]CUU38112.1 PDZ domain-containing protein [Armatimonadetes bacterium DC]
MRNGFCLWGWFALTALLWADPSVARERFEAAIQNHGGEAYRKLFLNGFKAQHDITREHGGKSESKRVEYRKGNKQRVEIMRGEERFVITFDGNGGWRKDGYLVTGLAQEEIWAQRDSAHGDFVVVPHWLEQATLVGGEDAKMPDGRSAFRIEFQFPLSEEQKKLPTKPTGKAYCYLDEKNQILGIQYELIDYETDEVNQAAEIFHNYREMPTPAGMVRMPLETRYYIGNRHVGTYFLTALDAQSEIADSLFERPPSEAPPIVRETLPTKVPFRMKGFSLYVEVKLNGKGPYWIILDTGAASTWIDAQIAKEAGLEKIPNSDYYGVMVYGAFPSYRARVKSLQIGNAEVRDLTIGVGELQYTPLGDDTLDGKKVIGLLGRETLSAFQMTVNFAERTITLEPPDAELPQGTVIPYEMFGDHILVTMGVGNKNQIRMIVDTGASVNLLPPSYKPDKADGVWMTLEEWTKRLGEIHEDDEYSFMTGDMRVYRLHKMTLGPLLFESVYAFQKLAEGARSDSIIASKTKHGLLGIPVMRHYKITFNYYRQLMVWQPNTEQERTADNAGYGIWWRKQGKDLFVRWVMPLSDADLQGVKKGDKIVLIDGQSPANWTEKQLVDRLSYTKPYRPLKLTVERNGKRLEFELIARNYEL